MTVPMIIIAGFAASQTQTSINVAKTATESMRSFEGSRLRLPEMKINTAC